MTRGKKRPFRFLWVTDPWDTLDHSKDTTLRLAQEALALGHESYWCEHLSAQWVGGRTLVTASKFKSISGARTLAEIELSEPRVMDVSAFSQVHYRTDPPVDLAYTQPLQILALGKAPIVNPVEMLLVASEKLEATSLGKLMPASIAACDREALVGFGRREGRVVLKPLHLAQSRGIERLDFRTPASRAKALRKLSASTEKFTKPVLLQRFLPGIARGETRLWFVDGKLLACIQKLPLQGDFRVNIDRGSGLAPARLNARDRRSATLIGRHLRSRGIRLAAVDLIDGYITDFNHTSPGLITQMETVLGKNLARPIIEALASR